MFESILERVLIDKLGSYVNGIEKKNLNVGWSDVTIENLSIKPEAAKKLNLPIEIKHSHIGKLFLNMSWTSITTRPIEIVLEDVFIVAHPLNKNNWAFDENVFFQKRLKLVEKLVESYALKLLEKAQPEKKPEEKSKGIFGELAEKIIDNLQVISLYFSNEGINVLK